MKTPVRKADTLHQRVERAIAKRLERIRPRLLKELLSEPGLFLEIKNRAFADGWNAAVLATRILERLR